MNKPNILVIHADQHRADCIGACGNSDIKTPNIDALAADGILHQNCFCVYPVCTPSRYSMLTGLYTHQHLGWTNRCTVIPGTATFPQLLRDAGYRTKAVGKMHFTPTYLDMGFEEMLLAEQDGPGRHDDDYHRCLRRKGLADRGDLTDQVKEYRDRAPREYWDTFGAMQSDLPERDYSTTWIGDRAEEALSDWSSEGNLLMVGFIKPHHPFDPPEPWSRMYDPDMLSPLPGWTEKCLPQDSDRYKGYFPNDQLTEKKLRTVMAMYYGCISQIDSYVGRFVDILKRRGIYDNTMIVYTSDHGDYMGFHHMILKGNYMYDPLVRIPLIIKYPHQENHGCVSDAPVSNIDICTTILAQAQCRRDNAMCGIDRRSGGRDYVFAEHGRGHEYMVRSRTRKLILCRDDGESCFFDLENDPYELNNLYNDMRYREEIETYRALITRWILFDAPSPVYLDENAPVIKGENVPVTGDGHREESDAYFRSKMEL
jgi:arylsulfatase